jgi:DoxX-like family
MTYVLWIIQVLLALLFLFSGGMKLVIPIDVLTSMGPPNQVHLPGLFIQFIGVCEVLGAFGLVLPGLLRIRTGLTPLAAGLLVIILIGATVLTLIGPGIVTAVAPFVTGLLTAFVAYGRSQLAPLRNKEQ